MPEQVEFTCNGAVVGVAVEPGESLLNVLRERLGIVSVKDGCAPQGQCGCCTVLVDGSARIACVTPATRVAGRVVTTLEGLDGAEVAALAGAFCATGGSQCGFCTPGMLVRLAALGASPARAAVDSALAAHACRCTGWQTIYEAVLEPPAHASPRDLNAASRRALLEGGVPQRVDTEVPRGRGGFADDTAPRRALVAVPLPPGSTARAVEAAGMQFVVAESLYEARSLAGKVQGRRTTIAARPPLALPALPSGGVRLATSWLEPAYLEPDASWCEPGGEPAPAAANGGAFGGKDGSVAPLAARELATRLGRAVRVVFAREDVVRHSPKRAPVAASARFHGSVTIHGCAATVLPRFDGLPYRVEVDAHFDVVPVAGLRAATAARAPWAERFVLVEGALDAAGVHRFELIDDALAAEALLDTCARDPGGALAGARVDIDPHSGLLRAVAVRVAAGDPLDETVLRSYAIGAVHQALGWVLTEGLAVDEQTGEPLDLTMRSFGLIRPKHMPPVAIEVLDDRRPPLARSTDAVFAAVAAAAWNALARSEGSRPEAFPALDTRTSRSLRR